LPGVLFAFVFGVDIQAVGSQHHSIHKSGVFFLAFFFTVGSKGDGLSHSVQKLSPSWLKIWSGMAAWTPLP